VALGASLLMLFLFFVHYRFRSPAACFVFPYHPMANYPWYASLMFANVLRIKGTGVLPTLAGGSLLLAGIALAGNALWRIVRAGAAVFDIVTFALSAFSLLLAASATAGRICLPLAFAQSSRYISYLLPMFLAFYFWLLRVGGRPRRPLLWTYLALAAWAGLFISHQDQVGVLWLYHGKRTWTQCYLRNENVAECNIEAGLPIVSDIQLGKSRLEWLKQNHLSLFSGN
jgi:hypothetical protein